MKKQVRRLTLSRETLVHLTEPELLELPAGAAATVPRCISPWCVPTFWDTCECVQ
jgi:hypothetical protein